MAYDRKEFLLGNKAKDLLKYTFTVTKPISDKGMSTAEAVALLRHMSQAEPHMAQQVAHATAETMSKNNKKKGFPKSALHSYVKTLQETAVNIVKEIHSANECAFQTEYNRRIELINKALDECNLMMKLVEVSHDLGYIDGARMQHWTKCITDVKYMTLAWKKKDMQRAATLEFQQLEKELNHHADVIGRAVYRAITETRNGDFQKQLEQMSGALYKAIMDAKQTR